MSASRALPFLLEIIEPDELAGRRLVTARVGEWVVWRWEVSVDEAWRSDRELMDEAERLFAKAMAGAIGEGPG